MSTKKVVWPGDSGARPKSEQIITSVRVEEGPGHDTLTVWNRGACTGHLVFKKGDGLPVALMLAGRDAFVEEVAEGAG